jgi:PAS domain S-box-containing protein
MDMEPANPTDQVVNADNQRQASIRFWLASLVLACVLPVWCGAGFLVYYNYQSKRALTEQRMLETSRALTLVADRDLAAMQARLGDLATSIALISDLAASYRRAQVLSESQPGVDIILSDATGQELFNTLHPYGAPLPKRGSLETVRQVFATGRPMVGNVYEGASSAELKVSVDVPVFRNGRVVYDLAMAVPSDRFAMVLTQQHLPPEWVGTMLDVNHVVVARTHSAEQFVGQIASPGLRKRMGEASEGTAQVTNLEGVPMFDSFSQSATTGWTVVIGVPREIMRSEIWRWLALTVICTILLSLTGIALALLMARRITSSIQGLVAPALALGRGEPVAIGRLELAEIRDVGESLLKASVLIQQRTVERERTLAARREADDLKRLNAELKRTEAEARARASELAAIMDAVPAATLIGHDSECRQMTGNRAAYELFRIPNGVNPSKSAPAGEAPSNFRLLREGKELSPAEMPVQMAAATGKEIRDCEFTIAFDDDTTCSIFGNAVPLFDESGTICGAVGAFIDITQRKKNEGELRGSEEKTQRALQALRKSEQRYRRVVDHILDALLVDDQAGHIIYANDRFLKLFGLQREDLPNLTLEDYVAPEWRSALRERHERRIRGEEVPAEFPYEGLRKDGSRLWLQAVVTPIVEDGRVIGTQSAIQDITARRRAELLQMALYRIAELARSAEDLQKLYASIHAIVGELIYARNCYIALYDPGTDMVSFPYFVDENDPPSPPRKFGRGLTEYILRTGQPLIATPEKLEELVRQGELLRTGSASLDWIGVPLKNGEQTVGALVLQSYEPIVQYGEAEKEILMIVSQQVSAAIQAKRSEVAIRESESKFRAVAETSPTLIIVTDGVRTFYVNRAAEVVSGYSRAELLAMDPWSFIPESYRATVKERAQSRMKNEGAPTGYEFPILTRSGEERWLGLRADTIEFGGKTAILGSAEDITERKRAEQLQSALYRITEQAAAAENLPQFFASLHAIVGELMSARNFYIALYDAPSDTLSFPYFVDEEDVTPVPKKLGKGLTEYVVRTGEPLLASPEVFQALVRRGEVEDIGAPSVDWLGVPLRSGAAIIGALVVQSYTECIRFTEKHKSILTFVSQNIAAAIERKRSADALSDSAVRYRSQVENAVYGIYRESMEGRFLEVNPALVSMLGYDATEEVLALQLSRDVYVESGEQAKIIEQCRRQDRIGDVEVRWKRKNGATFTARLSGCVVRNAQGEIEGMEMIAEDITERWMLEQQLRQAQKMEAVGRLAGGIAHDFNNLLMVIQSYTEMLQDSLPAHDTLRSYTIEVMKASQRAASLTGQMLAFSRKQITSPVVLDLNAVIREAANMLERLIGEDIEFQVIPAEPLWAIEADPDQIVQVLMNLCVNARDAMPKGGTLTVETGNLAVHEGGVSGRSYITPRDYVWFSVADTGRGISKEQQEQIFDPFFTTKEVGKGTGLGLAMVYGMVKQNSGYVWVDSEPGKGARFTILLPTTEGAITSESSSAAGSRARGTETLLVVEDEKALREAMGVYLRSLGYTVLLANSAQQALQVANLHEHIDLLVTDVVMPKMSGRELSQMLQSLRPDLKVIHMSGYTDDEVLRQGIHESGAHFLHKPFSLGTLARKLRDALNPTK